MRVQHHAIRAPHGSATYELTTLHFGPEAGTEKSKRAYIQAGLHADEVPGMLVAQHLRRRLATLEAEGRVRGAVTLVPAANPIGLAQAIHGVPFGRFDLATGINFNRAHKHVAGQLKQSLEGRLGGDAAANVALIRREAAHALAGWQVASDAEALKKALLQLAIGADIVLDLHCDNEAVLHVYTGTPLEQAVAPLAALLGSHATLLAMEAGGEPFDEACSRLWWDLAGHFGARYPIPPACVAATVELRGERDIGDQLAARDAAALLRYLALNGIVDADDNEAPLPPALCAATPLQGVEPILAPHPGILLYRCELGARVTAGTVLAELVDPASGDSTPLRCSVDGVFFARSAFRHVLRGMNVGKVAGRQPFRDGHLLSL